jgi:hypothetical protein
MCRSSGRLTIWRVSLSAVLDEVPSFPAYPPSTRGHAYTFGHPIVQSFEPGEDWRWCYFDEAYV